MDEIETEDGDEFVALLFASLEEKMPLVEMFSFTRELDATLNETEYLYTGSAITFDIDVWDADTQDELEEGTHYQLVAQELVAIGTGYTLTVKGIGDYDESTSVNFTYNINKTFTLAAELNEDEYYYTGEAIVFDIDVRDADTDEELVEGTHFQLRQTSFQIGPHTLTVEGIGDYAGSPPDILSYSIIAYQAPDILVNSPNAENWYLAGNPARVRPPANHVFHVLRAYPNGAAVDFLTSGNEGGFTIEDDEINDGAVAFGYTFGAGEIEIEYQLRNTQVNALSEVKTLTLNQDTGFMGLGMDTITITPRTDTLVYINDSGEVAYARLWIEGVHEDSEKWGTATARAVWCNDANKLENGEEKTITLSESPLLGSAVIVFARDFAGNVRNTEMVVEPHPVNGLAISGPDDVGATGGEFLIEGEPNELVFVHHDLSGFEETIQLDQTGRAKVVIHAGGNMSIMDTFGNTLHQMDGISAVHDSDAAHLQQQLTVFYADVENIALSDGEPESATLLFYYHTQAFPITVDPMFRNRDLTIDIILPEDGFVNKIQANGTDIYTTSNRMEVNRGQVVTYDLNWYTSPFLIVPGTGQLMIEYEDLGGMIWEGTFDISKSIVDEPAMMQIEPEPNTNGYFGQKDQNIVIFGTSVGYEPLIVEIGTTSALNDIIATGTGNYVQTNKGNWTTPFALTDLPKDVEIVVSVSYRDVIGPGTEMVIMYDDMCMPTIVVTPLYEGARHLAGITEVGALVRISCVDQTIKAMVDNYGFFHAELPMLFEGEEVVIDAYDLAGNHHELTLVVQEKPGPMKAHTQGTLFPVYDDLEEPDWMQATSVTKAELEEGVSLALLAGNLFRIGELHMRLVNGEVVVSYSLESDVELLEEYITLLAGEMDVLHLLNQQEQSLIPGESFAWIEDAGNDRYWVYASLQVLLTAERLEAAIERLTGL
ncbi:MAG: hypothetical protein FWD25_11530 [Clostridia bacterium]|nr:hypothetical protein [Clostridia bacterium]